MARPKKGELTETEQAFIDAYTTNGFDRRSAVKAAGIKCGDPSSYAAKMLSRETVQDGISKILEKRRTKFFVSELDVLEGLYKEAQLEKGAGGTQQGRIAAWQAIGKHLGMFDNKLKEMEKELKDAQQGTSGTNITIINYNQGPDQEEKDITPSKPALELNNDKE